MSLQYRTLQLSDLEEVLQYEQKKNKEKYHDETEQRFNAWNAKWRKEALEHYLPSGWCFVAREGDGEGDPNQTIVGYFIAQPLLFFDNQTQSLWVEHLQFSSLEARDGLCDLAYRMSREKHFQRVYFPTAEGVLNAVNHLKPQIWNQQYSYIKTTRT